MEHNSTLASLSDRITAKHAYILQQSGSCIESKEERLIYRYAQPQHGVSTQANTAVVCVGPDV